MSGKPGDIPKFVSDMLLPSFADQPTAEDHQTRPKSEVTRSNDHTPPSCDTRPKSDTLPASSANRLSYQDHQKSSKQTDKDLCKPSVDGYSTLGKTEAIRRTIPCPPKSKETSGFGSKDEKPPPLTINKETQQLVDELQRQYLRPVFINDGVQLFMDDMKERSMLSTGDSQQRKSEPRKYSHGLF